MDPNFLEFLKLAREILVSDQIQHRDINLVDPTIAGEKAFQNIKTLLMMTLGKERRICIDETGGVKKLCVPNDITEDVGLGIDANFWTGDGISFVIPAEGKSDYSVSTLELCLHIASKGRTNVRMFASKRFGATIQPDSTYTYQEATTLIRAGDIPFLTCEACKLAEKLGRNIILVSMAYDMAFSVGIGTPVKA